MTKTTSGKGVINVVNTCKDKVRDELRDRISDIRKLWRLYRKDPEACDEDLGQFDEYGLCFDYVPRDTFSDQKRGFFRWQLSYGGPQDEFRFFTDENLDPVEIEYWFLDWFDGARVKLCGRDYELLAEIFGDFKELGVVEEERRKAMSDC
ncbi:MAG: hypothetical protein PHI12_14455 [Dehalococcoidales bacterium]|nr:hypothetical protein [Dehalococcoidales bacterium]